MYADHSLIRIVAVHPEGLPSLLYVKDKPRKRSRWDGTPNNNWRWIATYDMFGTCPIDSPHKPTGDWIDQLMEWYLPDEATAP